VEVDMLRCSFRPLLVLASVLATTLTSSAAPAQSAVEPWAGLKTSDLDTIYVRDVNGAEMSGKLLQLNPDSLLLLVGGVERRFDLPEVSRIQKRDSLKNGTVIGAVTGIMMGVLAAGMSDCPGDEPGGNCAALRATALALSIGVYAGLGAGVDALIPGRTTVYERRRTAAAVASMTLPAHAPIRLSIAW
jgi:hypothetical protein